MRREQLAPYEARISVLALSTLHHRTLRRFHNRWDNLFQRAIQPQQVKSEKNTPDFTWKSGVSRPIHPVPSCGALRFPVCCDTLRHSADGKLTLRNSLSAYSHSTVAIINIVDQYALIYTCSTSISGVELCLVLNQYS